MVAVPSGIVTSIFAIGAVFGRLFGEVVALAEIGQHVPCGYAVVGAASVTAGVTGTFSIAVIMFELTGQLTYMIPVLVAVLVSRSVASCYTLDMYETITRTKQLPQWPKLSQQHSYSLLASDFLCETPTYAISRHQTFSCLQKLVSSAPQLIKIL